jgi:hypothetical protein
LESYKKLKNSSKSSDTRISPIDRTDKMHIQISEDILYNREMLWYINGLMQVRLSFGDILSKFLVSSAIINPTQVHDMCETSMTRLLSSD